MEAGAHPPPTRNLGVRRRRNRRRHAPAGNAARCGDEVPLVGHGASRFHGLRVAHHAYGKNTFRSGGLPRLLLIASSTNITRSVVAHRASQGAVGAGPRKPRLAMDRDSPKPRLRSSRRITVMTPTPRSRRPERCTGASWQSTTGALRRRSTTDGAAKSDGAPHSRAKPLTRRDSPDLPDGTPVCSREDSPHLL